VECGRSTEQVQMIYVWATLLVLINTIWLGLVVLGLRGTG